jgi:hypothetical protein
MLMLGTTGGTAKGEQFARGRRRRRRRRILTW